MFVSSGQIYVFIACIAYGGIVGLMLFLSSILKLIIKNKAIGVIFDIVALILSSILYVVYSFSLSFPNFRTYMILGVLLGVIIYYKSFNIILAKIIKVIYNSNILKKLRAKNVRIKSKKGNNI